MFDGNIIYIGKKPPMNYVLAIVTQLNGESEEVILKARGRLINKTVDVAEIVRNKFVKDAQVTDITIGTESMKTEDGSTLNVSSIEITLSLKETKTAEIAEAEG